MLKFPKSFVKSNVFLDKTSFDSKVLILEYFVGV